jgi:hypothetical protein
VAGLRIEPAPPPVPPTAEIVFAGPLEIREGETVELRGKGSDSDGKIVAYEWSSNIDGVLGDSQVIAVNTLSLGDHTVSLRVRDDDDLWSKSVSVEIVVKPFNTEPTALIESITPEQAEFGERVTFSAFAMDEEDEIATYQWTSDIDGLLYSGPDSWFTTTDLSPGEHMITLKVKDERDMWSSEVSGSIVILEKNEVPAVGIDTGYRTVGPGDRFKVRGWAEDPENGLEIVEYRVDNGPWAIAVGTEEWYITLDASDLKPGDHMVRVRAFDGEFHSEEASVNFTVREPTIWENIEEFDPATMSLIMVVLFMMIFIVIGLGAYNRRLSRRKRILEEEKRRSRTRSRKRRKRRKR